MTNQSRDLLFAMDGQISLLMICMSLISALLLDPSTLFIK